MGASKRLGELRIGTSGYQYRHWRGRLYPRRMPVSHWLAHYARHFDTVEMNVTFYGLPQPEVFEAWCEQVPANFRFALKFSRYGSHMKHLREPRRSLRPFLQRAVRLGDRLGPILVQLPPRWRADPGRLAAFLDAARPDLRWAFEFRDPSWLDEEVLDVLRDHGAALCLHDLLEDHPRLLTAGWTYLRFHGPPRGGGYSPQALGAVARRVRRWRRAGADVYAYFNNDRAGHAVVDAERLRRLAGEGRRRRARAARSR